jgi:hypothetical protein
LSVGLNVRVTDAWLTMKKQSKPLPARQVFARNLRKLRRLSDISQEELALRCE